MRLPKRPVWTVAIGALLLLGSAVPAAAGINPCRPGAAASIAVLPNPGGRLLVPLRVDDVATVFELDTGSDLSLMAPALAERLGLRIQKAIEPLLAGADGRPLTDYVMVPKIDLAGQNRLTASFVVPPQWSVVDARATGMLGGDILRSWDIELDLGESQVRLYPRNRCLGAVAPFHDGAETIPIDALLGHVIVPIRLDGQDLHALLDTGATFSSMSLPTARRLFNLVPGVRGVTESGTTITTDGGRLASWTYQFHALEIGRTRLDQPSIDLVAEAGGRHMASDHDMVLGLRELRQMRLYIAYGQNKLLIARSPV